MLVDALGFLSADDQNEVRLPVVKFLASQRVSSIQTLVTYFIVVRLVLINRISLQHCRPVNYVQEPNAEPVSSRRNLLGDWRNQNAVFLLRVADRKPQHSTATASRSRLTRLPLVLCALRSGGPAFAARGSGRAPRPGAVGGWRGAPVALRKTWSGPVLPPPKFPGVAMGSCLR
jgi:hypothetical protein